MAEYTGRQSILNAALGEYQAKGFRLMELDDHALTLCYQDALVGRFSQTSATIPLIRQVCQEYLDSLAAGLVAS